jgi:hypothetical protein
LGEAVIIYGKSGSGKSRSLLNFADDEIFLVNTIGKRLPMRKNFKYVLKTDKVETIKEKLAKMPCQTAVIDDAGYLLTNTFMRGHSAPKSGGSVYDLYNNIADNFWGLLNYIKKDLPDNILVYIIMHEESNDFGDTKLKTIGKLLDNTVCIEGMVTIALRCIALGGKYIFRTQSDGTDISKSPEGMFPLEIENDLKAVDVAIREYWGLTNSAPIETEA